MTLLCWPTWEKIFRAPFESWLTSKSLTALIGWKVIIVLTTIRYGFSLAGVQPKFSMRHDGKALALPATGKGGDWIVKLPDRRFPHVPENEYSMLTWAKRSGIDIPEIDLVWGSDLQEYPGG